MFKKKVHLSLLYPDFLVLARLRFVLPRLRIVLARPRLVIPHLRVGVIARWRLPCFEPRKGIPERLDSSNKELPVILILPRVY